MNDKHVEMLNQAKKHKTLPHPVRYLSYNFNSFQFCSIVFVILSIAIYNTFWGLRVYDTGVAGDSTMYLDIAIKGLIKVIEEGSILGYHQKRFLPAMCVYWITYIFDIKRSVPNIVILSSCLNLSALIGACIFWLKLCKHEKISPKSSLLGVVLLFTNFLGLIFYFFQPILTDYLAFFFAISSLYFYRSQKYFYLTLVSILFAFTWPIALYMNIPFFLFKPDHRKMAGVSSKLKTTGIDGSSRIFLMVCIFSYIISYFYFNSGNLPSPMMMTPIVTELLPLTMAFNFLYIFMVLTCIAPVTNVLQTSVDILKNLSISRRHIFLFSFLILVTIIYYNISGSVGSSLPNTFIHLLLLSHVSPLRSISAHTMAMGILPVLFIYYIYEIFKWAEKDRALWVIMLMQSIFFLSTETRHAICFFPVLVFILCKVIDLNTRNLNPMKIYLIFFTNLLLLGFYSSELTSEWYDWGPWMTHIQYIYGLFWAILSGFLVYILFPPSGLIYHSRKVFHIVRSFTHKGAS